MSIPIVPLRIPAAAVAALLLGASAAPAVTIDWVPVADPGNAPDAAANCSSAGCGSVGYRYEISRYEITNAQYAEFLNAVAASDPYGLYNPQMANVGVEGGIAQTGSAGSYAYAPNPGYADKPVVFVGWYDSIRFANWMHNGQAAADTETGAYTLLGGTPIPSNGDSITRNPGAQIALPSENEWYKAAYHDPISNSFFAYPTGTNVPTVCAAPGSDTGNSANCDFAAAEDTDMALTDVGTYPLSESPSATLDQGGNAAEWTETADAFGRIVRGGDFGLSAVALASSFWFTGAPPHFEGNFHGFRLVRLVPEPGNSALFLIGLAALSTRFRATPAS